MNVEMGDHMALRLAAVRVIAVLAIACARASAGPVDDYVTVQMERRKIPGLALAVVQRGRW